jgi:hypothetical protein
MPWLQQGCEQGEGARRTRDLLGACDEDDFAGEVGEVALRLELGRGEGEHGVVGVWLHHLARIL